MARRGHPSLRLLGAQLALILLVVSCDAAPAAPTASPSAAPSGIAGVVMLGPTCSTPTAADPCLTVYSARLVVFDTNGQVVGRVESGGDGRFALPLPPGDYIIQPAPGGDPFPRAEARSITVVQGEVTQVEIDYETRDRATDTGSLVVGLAVMASGFMATGPWRSRRIRFVSSDLSISQGSTGARVRIHASLR